MDAWENQCKKEFNFIKQERIKAALEEKERNFAAAHSESSREELSGYLRACADSLGHTPGPMEIIGSRVILERFGTWTAAVDAAGLDPVVPRRAALSLCATALYYAEEQAQWLAFRKVTDGVQLRITQGNARRWLQTNCSGCWPNRNGGNRRKHLQQPTQQTQINNYTTISKRKNDGVGRK